MTKHVGPFRFYFGAEGSVPYGFQRRDFDPRVSALLRQDVQDEVDLSEEVRMLVGVHDVVQVSRPATFHQGPQLLPEDFRKRVGVDIGQVIALAMSAVCNVAERVKDRAAFEGEHNDFVCCEVEFHFRFAWYPERPDIRDSPLDGGLVSPVAPSVK